MWAATSLAAYQRVWGETHATPAASAAHQRLMYCAPTDAEAEAVARVHMAEYYLSVLDHYELLAGHFEGVRGYEMYARASEVLSSTRTRGSGAGVSPGAELGRAGDHPATSCAQRRELVGDFELSVIARYGTLPVDRVEASLRLFAAEVLPELKRW